MFSIQLRPRHLRLVVLAATTLVIGLSTPSAASRPSKGARIAKEALAAALSSDSMRTKIRVTKVHLVKTCRVTSGDVVTENRASSQTVRLHGKTRSGTPCSGWAYAKVRRFARVVVATKSIRTGQALGGAVRIEEREVSAGDAWLTVLPSAGRARHAISSGRPLRGNDVIAAGPPIGASLSVRLRSGSLVVTGQGVRVQCRAADGPPRVCARLASGSRVEGQVQDGALWVAR